MWNSEIQFFYSQACTEAELSAQTQSWAVKLKVEAEVEARSSTLAQGGRRLGKLRDSMRCTQLHKGSSYPCYHDEKWGQYMLWRLLLGGKGWDLHARDQTVDLSSFYFSDMMHVYEFSLGFPKWNIYIYLKASIRFSAAAACSTKDATARPRAELQTIVKILLFGYFNYLQQLKPIHAVFCGPHNTLGKFL